VLYCMKCRKYATNKKHPCKTKNLISITKDMLPIVLKADSIGLQVASAFSITESCDLVGAYVYFNRLYPELLLQELPTGWYLSDYATIDNQAICSCLSYESLYKDTECLEVEVIESAIDGLLNYLDTRDRDSLMSVLTLLTS
jgi:hypothetical protein